MSNNTPVAEEEIIKMAEKFCNENELWYSASEIPLPEYMNTYMQGFKAALQYKPVPDKWIKVEDDLPNEGDCVVCYMDTIVGFGHAYDILCFYNGEFGVVPKNYNITHWQPLPKPPNEKRQPVDNGEPVK